jgi:hypothetical protein
VGQKKTKHKTIGREREDNKRSEKGQRRENITTNIN